MSELARALAESLDPGRLARRLGIGLDDWQLDVLRSSGQYELLCCARQTGKSTVAALKAVHIALTEPGSLIVVVSPSQRQSTELYRRIAHYWKVLDRPVAADVENRQSIELANGSRVVATPGDADTIRSLAAVRLLVADEASRISDDLMVAARPMVAVSGGQILALSTPYGRRGWYFRAATGDDKGWRVTLVPARRCPRLTEAFLAQEKANLGELEYASEYECSFVANAGGVFAGSDVDRAFVDDLPAFDPGTPLGGRRLRAVPESVGATA